tara:strand:+ start:974 stop:2329 length:1356 start_codon:yes stop_codon:yes gene_type:complete
MVTTERASILGADGKWVPIAGNLVLPWNAYIPITLTAKQLAFLLLNCLDAFFGGAAGGAKSFALLAAALQYIHVPGYSAIIFRKTFSDLSLSGALIDVAHQWLDSTDARWNETTKTWSFPSGATLSFGYLDGPRDKFRYQSAAFQFIGFDELTQLREADFTYMFSRCRKKVGSDIPLRVRSASNPGGFGHDWVKQRYITEGMASGRPYIRSTLKDNPHLDEESYMLSLSELDPITRAQLVAGDWTVRAGANMFKREWFPIVPTVPAGLPAIRFWDLASTAPAPGKRPDWTVGLRLEGSPSGRYYVSSVRRFQSSPQGVEKIVRQTAELDGHSVAIYMEQEPGSAGVTVIDYYTRKVLAGYFFEGVRSTGSKVERAAPCSSQAEAGNISLVGGNWVGDFLDEIEGFPSGEFDDQVDGLSGAFGAMKDPHYAEIFMPEYMRNEPNTGIESAVF